MHPCKMRGCGGIFGRRHVEGKGKQAHEGWQPGQPQLATFGASSLAKGLFARTGFAGALGRYRNHRRDFDWAGGFDPVIRRPALFIGGSSDPALVLGTADPVPLMREVVPDLEAHMLAGCGHWTQAERAAEVEALLIPWLRRTVPA
eukprot:gene8850-11248_t